jgi:hypothetical protein
MLEDALQRRHDRRKGAEILDELGPRRFGLGIVDGLPASSSIGTERCAPVSSVKIRIWRVGKRVEIVATYSLQSQFMSSVAAGGAGFLRFSMISLQII